jgi:hypothetical protein
MKFRLCGVYDERGYRYYTSMTDFLVSELTTENYGRTFFAHNGGKSDLHFVLDELIKSGLGKRTFAMEVGFNGSSAFLAKLRKRDDPRKGYTFADTLFLLKARLAKIGEWLGYPKLELKGGFETEDFNELRYYNERDCMLLYKAVRDLESELFEMGGEFRITLASSAMTLFQTRYLREILQTLPEVNDYTRQGYYASRVEVFTREFSSGLYYDVNSSFPWSMKQSLPGAHRGTRHGFDSKPAGAKHYMVDATIRIKDCYLPPAPYRDPDNRILFPTGEWRAVFTDTDFDLLQSEGHTVETVHQVDWFDGFTALSDYVDDLYERKATATGFKREVYKLLLNSLYGKFAEGETKKKLLIWPEQADFGCSHKPAHPRLECITMMAPGIYVREDRMPINHVHVPISAKVTALSRKLLFDYLRMCKRIAYSDTDSAVVSMEDGPTLDAYLGEEVGKLKLEYILKNSHFAAPKLYMMDAAEPGKNATSQSQIGESKIVVKSKGYSRLDGVDYMTLCAGEAVTLHRMVGMKENLKAGDTTPKEITISKYARFVKTKRADVGNGETRPWTITELTGGANKVGKKRKSEPGSEP